ncbi:DUF3679 domain-containing protein [Pseudalkalibacillus caeni]|uniref:DUF3679 domain-containing protein n=1 Tax=Exobacillus caeni TaxID=2574798 RepID=A0A5R9FID9_9BACL|nr:DUF3679 domain-containing protein [Pseudalkalibacillus caeni]TLS39345.1 DUF3679 domain-containing protein [Pseudalkalibacillus caeni]
MASFFIKCTLLTGLLFFGVLLGMQQANKGMIEMQGNNEASGAFYIGASQDGKLEAEVMGSKVTSHDLAEKQKKMEDTRAFNVLSSLGKTISAMIVAIVQNAASLLIELFKGLLSLFG